MPALSPACHAFSLLFCPHPPSPLPLRGRGRLLVYFAGGFAPGTPALNRLRHLHSLPCGYSAQGRLRFGAEPTEVLSSEQCRQPRRGGTGGEELRRLRWSSPPGQVEPVPQRGKPPAGRAVRPPAPVPPPAQARGCKGRSPLHKNNLSLPLPAGKGVGGMGAGNKAKGRAGGRGERQAPPRVPEWQGRQATSPPAPPPPGTAAAGRFPPRCAPSPFCTNPAAIFGTGCGLTGAAETYIIGRETYNDSEAP